jgi:LemA protein
MQKKKNYTGLIIVGAVLLFAVIFVITTYNSIVKKEEKVKQQWAEVQSTYQRRLDLVPNLVNTVKGVADFESSTLEQIAAARAEALSVRSADELTAENVNAQQRAQDNLANAANRLIVVVEKYPTLKGTAAYSGLQTQLEGTERRIKVARNDFNAAVADYNKQVRNFPGNIVAGLFGYKPKEGFVAAAGSDQSVEIKF